MPIYRQTGGATYTIDPVTGQPALGATPGADAQTVLNKQILEGDVGPTINVDDPTQTIKDVAKIEADPKSQPDFYGGSTVAALDPATLQSFKAREDAERRRQGILQDREATYRKYLTPEYQQQAAQRGAQAATTAAFGAGGRGSGSTQYLATLGAEEAARKAEAAGLEGLSQVATDLGQSGELLSGIGEERRNYIQQQIDEDIKRWNFAQLAPGQLREKLVQLATTLKALETGNVAADAGGGGNVVRDLLNDTFTSIASSVGSKSANDFLSIFNNLAGGGPVYKAGGGMINYLQAGGMGGIADAEPMAPTPGLPTSPGPGMGQEPMMSPSPMEPPAGIAGAEMGGEHMGGLDMEYEEPKSELDIVEDQLRSIAAASGGNIKITRKVKKGGSK